MGFFRSKVAAVVLFGGALVWFLYNISQLGEADFGQYKGWLLIIFGIVGLGAFKWVNEFLSVRGVAILVLMSARVLLDAAYMHTGHGIVFFVSFIYVMILLSLYLGALPYRARDLAKWFFADVKRVRVLGLVLAGYGLLLLYATISLAFSN